MSFLVSWRILAGIGLVCVILANAALSYVTYRRYGTLSSLQTQISVGQTALRDIEAGAASATKLLEELKNQIQQLKNEAQKLGNEVEQRRQEAASAAEVAGQQQRVAKYATETAEREIERAADLHRDSEAVRQRLLELRAELAKLKPSGAAVKLDQ